MTIVNGYIDLAGFHSRYTIGDTDTSRDATIENIIEAVSREIDNKCHRVFYSTTDDETRVFTATTPLSVYPWDDVLGITTLKTDDDNDGIFEQTWAADDYITHPIGHSPITWIEPSGRGSLLRFPSYRNSVQITGTFGYCQIINVPKPISEACYIQSHRIFKRIEAPFGVIGGNDFGTPVIITKFDGDVESLISPYVKLELI